MSLRNFRRSKVAPPPAKYDPEWVNQLRRALDELGVEVDPAVNSPLGLTHDYFPYRLHLVGNLDGLDLSDGTLDGRMLTVGDASGTYGVDYRQLTSPTGSLSIAVTASELQIEQNPSYAASLTAWETLVQTIATGDLLTLYDASEAGLYSLDARGFMDLILAEVPSPYYQYVRDSGGTLLAQESVLGITAPLKATDAAPDTTLKLAATAADKYLYSTAIDTWAEGAITTFGRSLLDDADAATGRNTLGASTGVWGLAVGGTAANLSATGGTGQFLRQSSAGAAVTVSAIGHADLGSGGGGSSKYLREDMSWQTVSAGVTGSGVANQVAYWSGTSALTGDADLVFNGTQLLTSGLFVGALTGTPARVLEARSTSAQLRLSYDVTYGADFAVSIAGHLSITTTAGSGGAINIGRSSAAAGANTPVAIGVSASAGGSQSLALGVSSSAAGNSDVALGPGCVASAGFGIAIGYSADAITGGAGVAIGTSTQCVGANAVSIGTSASAATASSIAIGNAAAVSSQIQAIAMGTSAAASGQNSIAIGASANASATGAIAIGNSATCATANTCVFGGSNNAITDIYAGKGITHAAAAAWTLNGTGGSGTDIAGGALNLAGGKPTGSGVGGSVVIKTAPAGASGTTLRTLADRLTVDQKGNVALGTAALATTATDGFLYVPTCAGAPSGVPTTFTGRVALIYDTTNKKLYVYNAAWEGVVLA